MIIEKEMIVTEMRSTHMPVKVLGFQVEAENIGEKSVEGSSDFLDSLRIDV
jgi:hypothetical protein